jgi:integrase
VCAIHAFIKAYNNDPKPIVWTASVWSIIEKVYRGKAGAALDLAVAQEDGNPIPPQRLSDGFRAFISHVDVTKVRFHDLRHTHATHALRAGVHPKVVSERLGHSSVAITLDLYSRVLEGMQAEGAAKVDEAIQAALAKLA